MGPQREVEELMAVHGGRLFNLALALTGNAADAEDLLQTVAEKLLQRWSRGGASIDSSYAYARAAVVRTHISSSRRRAHLVALLPRATRDSPTAESPHDLQVERLHLQGLLQQLPLRQRQAVVLRYLEDLPVEHVAELMTVRPGTVKSNAHDGLRALQLLIEAQQQREILQ